MSPRGLNGLSRLETLKNAIMKGARKNSVKPLPKYVLTNTKTPNEMRRLTHIAQTTKN